MASLIKLVDTVIIVFLTIVAVAAPLDAGLCLNSHIQPDFFAHLNPLYARKYGKYLATQKPGFFIALVWLEVVVMWPLAVINLYCILGGRRWFSATSLVFGASYCTAMLAVVAELMWSNAVSNNILTAYILFIGCSVLTILRGLLPMAKRH